MDGVEVVLGPGARVGGRKYTEDNGTIQGLPAVGCGWKMAVGYLAKYFRFRSLVCLPHGYVSH